MKTERYTAVVAYINGPPDVAGDILGPDVTFKQNPVPVTMNFDKEHHVGLARLYRRDNKIMADITMSVPPIVATSMYSVVGGIAEGREEVRCDNPICVCRRSLINPWTINSLGITQTPSDKTLPKIKKSRRKK